jgi:LysM repeat protein
MHRRGIAGPLAGTVGILLVLCVCSTASAAVPHTVMPGETLWSIAAANNFTTSALAAYNGVAGDAEVHVGETIEIPTEAEAAAALASAASEIGTESSTSSAASSVTHVVQPGETLWSLATNNGLSVATVAAYNGIPEDSYVIVGQRIRIPATGSSESEGSSAPASWLGPIPSPSGSLYLASSAAAAWNAMRQESLSLYNVDLYPGGPLSAYRTYDQQAYLYHLYVSGQGPPADPPGTSSHELGAAVDVATPEMRWVIDQIGARYGWGKIHAPNEWWHVDYLG